MPGPVTPMSRARLAVRAIHRFKQAGQRQRNSQAAADAEGLGPVEEEEAQPSATTPLLEEPGSANMRSPSGLVTDSMLPPMLKRNFRTTSITSASGDLESQDDGLGRSPIAHANSMPLSDGGAPPVAAGGDGKAKLTSLASAAGLPKIEPEDEPDAAEVPGVIAVKGDVTAIWGLLTSSYLNVLLLSVPLGYLAHALSWAPLLRFSLVISCFENNFLSLVPLALLLGEVTEDLAVRFGDTVGGLLNATFGNVVELILSIAALQKGLYDVVATSLVGSVLSNLLLVLGCCFLVGGTQYHNQKFNAQTNKAMCSLLVLASIALAMPTALHDLYTGKQSISSGSLLSISHYTSIMLVGTYCFYLYFQLKTHNEAMQPEANDSALDSEAQAEIAEGPALSLLGSISILTVITLLVAAASEFLTGAIEEVSESTGVSRLFLGLIVLPIAGNAAEHITAVFVAAKDKMDLAIAVALGSSIQIAIFVLPVVCLVGWATKHAFTLDLDPLSIIILTLSVIHAYFVSNDGTSNWLMGVQLIVTYLLIAIVYFFRSS